jgi:hypothetical protein
MNTSGSQGTQCVHQDFSSRRRHGYIPAERIHVRILGHTRWILGSYLRDIFQPRHSSFIVITQLENYISQPCLTESIYAIFRVILFNFYEYLLMGVINVYFCWQCSQSSFLLSFVDFFLSGARQRSRWEYTWALIQVGPGWAGSGRAKKKLDSVFCGPGLARPDYRLQITAQARPVGINKPSGRRARPSVNHHFFPTQARPVTLVGPKNPAQARLDSMLWPDGSGHFWAGPGQAGLPMHSYRWE